MTDGNANADECPASLDAKEVHYPCRRREVSPASASVPHQVEVLPSAVSTTYGEMSGYPGCMAAVLQACGLRRYSTRQADVIPRDGVRNSAPRPLDLLNIQPPGVL
jgi:hypothetical protein